MFVAYLNGSPRSQPIPPLRTDLRSGLLTSISGKSPECRAARSYREDVYLPFLLAVVAAQFFAIILIALALLIQNPALISSDVTQVLGSHSTQP